MAKRKPTKSTKSAKGAKSANSAKAKAKRELKAKPKAKANPEAKAKAKPEAKAKANASGGQPTGKLANHEFLKPMYADSYFPKRCVDKVKHVLVALCAQIETKRPADLEALYRLTHAATEQINDLAEDFDDNDSEIETAAREAIALEFVTIATTYGFDADMETLISNRDW